MTANVVLRAARRGPAGRLVLLGGAAGLLVAGLLVAPPAEAIATPAASVVRVLKDSRIVESSGLARSRISSTRLWTHNDSGDTARLFAVGTGGATVRTFTLTGASHKDWEGMASAVKNGVSYLYAGDIGDNGKVRPQIYVHRIREPKPSAPSGSRTPVTWAFRYPDGPHNAETLMVRPGTLRIYIVTKATGGGAIYRAPATLSRTKVNVLTRVRSVPAGMSDGVFLSKGRFVLRVYQTGYLYASMTAAPVPFRFPDKGEGVASDWTSNHVYISNEGQYTPIWRVRLP